MTDELFQGFGGMAGTNNAILSSHDYISQARTSFNNIEDGYYISPAFLDKMTVHVAKNFMDLPKIKVPLILGIWGGKGQGKTFQVSSSEAYSMQGPSGAQKLCHPLQLHAPPSIGTSSWFFGTQECWLMRVCVCLSQCSALWPTRSWAFPPSSCLPVSWSPATLVSLPS